MSSRVTSLASSKSVGKKTHDLLRETLFKVVGRDQFRHLLTSHNRIMSLKEVSTKKCKHASRKEKHKLRARQSIRSPRYFSPSTLLSVPFATEPSTVPGMKKKTLLTLRGLLERRNLERKRGLNSIWLGTPIVYCDGTEKCNSTGSANLKSTSEWKVHHCPWALILRPIWSQWRWTRPVPVTHTFLSRIDHSKCSKLLQRWPNQES